MSRLRRILFLLAPVFLGLVIFGYCYSYKKTRQQPIVFIAPKAAEVEVLTGTEWHRRRDGQALQLDVYRPPGSGGAPLPAVVLVHGDGPESVIDEFKEWGQVTSWARNIAAYGVAAVTFDHSSTEMLANPYPFAEEVERLLEYLWESGSALGVDGSRVCLFTLSSAAPFALRGVLRDKPPSLRCLVIFYGALGIEAFPGDRGDRVREETLTEFDLVRYLDDRPEAVPPVLLAQGARDYSALNASMEAFGTRAQALGIPVETLTHPQGDHAFDLGSNDLESRRIIRAALEFMAERLTASEDAEEESVDDHEPVDVREDQPEEAPGSQ